MTQVALKQNLDHNWTLKRVLSNLCVKTLLVLILHCLAKDGHWYPYPALVFHDGCCFEGRARPLKGAEGDKVLLNIHTSIKQELLHCKESCWNPRKI